jgi:N-acetylneuraminic acid mutarotase
MGHGQVVVELGGKGYLYVFGGRQPAQPDAKYDGAEIISSLNDMHRLELATGRWEELACTGALPSGRSYCAAVARDQTIYLFGGMVNDDRHSDLHAFDTATNTWSRLPDGPMEGRGGAGLCSAKGSLWVRQFDCLRSFVFLFVSCRFDVICCAMCPHVCFRRAFFFF